MSDVLKKVLWLAVFAGLAYVGYQHPPDWDLARLVGVPSSSATEASARNLTRGCVNVNAASYQDLQRIKYVNPIRAKTILELRMDRPFRSLDDLTRIKGINSYRVEEIRSQGVACIRG